MLDAAQLGASLRAVRDRRGISQQQAAAALGLPRTAVTNMESGARAISTLELSKLAALYEQPVTAFLGSAKTNLEDLSIVLPRALPEIMRGGWADTEISHIVDLCQEGAKLRELLGLTVDQALPSYSGRPASVGEALRQAETVAREERRRLGLGNAPIGDIAELIASQGVWTAVAKLSDELSGLFVSHPAIGLAIIVNADHAAVRKRFSYAHEYAHALLDRDQGVVGTSSQNASELVEKRANAFAAAFLMPAEGIADQLRQLDKGNPSRQAQILFDVATDGPIEAEIRPLAGSQAITYQDVAVLAQHFRVSYDAMVWRLKSIDKLGAAATTGLFAQREVGRRYSEILGFSSSEASSTGNDRRRELRTQLTRLTIEAFRRAEISAGRVRELSAKLAIAADDLAELAEAARAE